MPDAEFDSAERGTSLLLHPESAYSADGIRGGWSAPVRIYCKIFRNSGPIFACADLPVAPSGVSVTQSYQGAKLDQSCAWQ
jgi:hypothetical protein